MAIDPEGEVVSTTSHQDPYVTIDVDLADAEAAKDRFPRYVPDVPLRRTGTVRGTRLVG